jgi:uncharacterized membrane protein
VAAVERIIPTRIENSLMGNQTLVLAVFKDEAAADSAAELVKNSGLARKDAIGVLVLDEKGEINTAKVGHRSAGKGAGIGLALALLTPVGLVVGAVGGGLLGALHHKGLGLSDADRVRIGSELGAGKAAVGVLAPVSESVPVSSMLAELGGMTQSHTVKDSFLEEAQAAAAGR